MTSIQITTSQGTEIIAAYESCTVNTSITERAGSFSITIPFLSEADISRFKVGNDVRITQDGRVFRGWVMKPPKKNIGRIKTITLEGADYTAKTQKIIATESYINQTINYIVNDLATKYLSWITAKNIQACDKVVTIRFPDMYLWECMEQICTLSGYDWYIDENLQLNFYDTATSINTNVITANNYKQGTANFTPDASKIVNKLWVKGSKAISSNFTQNITVSGTTPIQLYYTPRTSVSGEIIVTIGGVTKTLGIQNIDKAGTKDFLINAAEKLLVPDLCTTGTGTIVYRYEYPLKILLEDTVSQATYGIFEDVINVDTSDRTIAKEFGQKYLKKYANPVLLGSIQPISGIYKAGELVKVEIPTLDIDEYLLIKETSYNSVSGMANVEIALTLENTQNDLADILKDMSKRLDKVEKTLFGTSDNALVEKYKMYSDDLLVLVLSDTMAYNLHSYLLTNANIMLGNFTI